MIISFPFFLLASFVIVQPSEEYPVSMLQSGLDSQKVASANTEEMESGYSIPEKIDGDSVNLLKGEGEDEGVEGAQDLQELTPNTADTMRKINPLTIADQVSQMFRKGSQKANIANKSRGVFRSPERDLRVQEHLGDQSLAISAGSEGEDSFIQPGYLRQGVPRIVNKPRSNDYGYSVIVLAGDAAHLPVKVQGKSGKGQGRVTIEDKVDVQKQGVCSTGETEDKMSLEERTPTKEVRVYKQFSKNADFPVYDEDFNFIPDPLQGILDENYRTEVGKDSKKPASPLANLSMVDNTIGLHHVRIRSDEGAESANDNSKNVACSFWGKGNATDS